MQNNNNTNTITNPPLVLHGPSISISPPTGMEFNPNRPYIYCRICGEIYQPPINRSVNFTLELQQTAVEMRNEWSRRHNRNMHTDAERLSLENSGRHLTPEAVLKLVPFGIIPLTDIVYSQITDETDHEQAGLEAKRMPQDDVEGV